MRRARRRRGWTDPRRARPARERRSRRRSRPAVPVRGPSTITYSPRGSSAPTCPTASDSSPRHTSSYSFVSSRATATSRNGPHAASRSDKRREHAARALRTAPSCAALRRARRSARGAPVRAAAGTPRTRIDRSGSPESTSAVSTALGPGTTSTASPASRHARTRRSPGSDTPGMPASVTYATRLPELHDVDDRLRTGAFVVGVNRTQATRRPAHPRA